MSAPSLDWSIIASPSGLVHLGMRISERRVFLKRGGGSPQP
jgi:hypothetical protein